VNVLDEHAFFGALPFSRQQRTTRLLLFFRNAGVFTVLDFLHPSTAQCLGSALTGIGVGTGVGAGVGPHGALALLTQTWRPSCPHPVPHVTSISCHAHRRSPTDLQWCTAWSKVNVLDEHAFFGALPFSRQQRTTRLLLFFRNAGVFTVLDFLHPSTAQCLGSLQLGLSPPSQTAQLSFLAFPQITPLQSLQLELSPLHLPHLSFLQHWHLANLYPWLAQCSVPSTHLKSPRQPWCTHMVLVLGTVP